MIGRVLVCFDVVCVVFGLCLVLVCLGIGVGEFGVAMVWLVLVGGGCWLGCGWVVGRGLWEE